MKRTSLAVLGTAPLLFLEPRPAAACGGFFCSQVPVLQTAEKIVFEVSPAQGEVVAYVQLQYQGADPRFAWIVPVPEAPEVTVGVGQAMFDALEAQTQPVFITADGASSPAAALDMEDSGCGFDGGGFVSGEPRLSAELIPAPEVEVHQSERVGPYDVTTLSAASAADLNTWLRVNGYRVLPGSEPIVQSYLDQGMKLLALKLSNEADATQVEPIRLRYKDTRGCAMIPIRLTAIAATPGLEIVAWVFGESRAFGVNYREIAVDPIELATAGDYLPAMRRRLDEDGTGHGFVTEFAQPTERLSSRGDPILNELLQKHGYVTRLRTELDPREMTVDPEIELDAARTQDVSNRIPLRKRPTFAVSAGSLLGLIAIGLRLRAARRAPR